MASTKKTFTTPKGTAVFPRVNTPDTKFDAKGTYSIKLALPASEGSTQKLAAFIQKRYDDYIARITAESNGRAPKTNPVPFEDEYDEQNNKTGNIIFKFGSVASGVNKKTGKPWNRTINLFDAKGKPVTSEIWGGSTVKISFTVGEYKGGANYGVKCYLEAVQILELVNGSSREAKASQYGFGEEEGYSAEEDTAGDFGSEGETSGDTSGDADGSDF